MGLLEDMRRALPSLTKTEARAAEAFLDNPALILQGSITQIARITGTSNSALIRLSQKLGYNGFSEFRFSMNRALLAHEGALAAGERESDLASDINRLADVYASYVRRIASAVTEEEVDAFARAIVGARRIDIWGVNRTAESAQQLSHRLTRLGVYNKWTSDPIVMSDDADILGEGDVAVVITLSGRGFARYDEAMDAMRQRGVDVHLITMNRTLKLAEHATHTYYLPWISRDESINFYEDQIIAMMFIELVLLRVSRLLNKE